jgi:predicted Zn-ribbon and HTH transcriptional regulator
MNEAEWEVLNQMNIALSEILTVIQNHEERLTALEPKKCSLCGTPFNETPKCTRCANERITHD